MSYTPGPWTFQEEVKDDMGGFLGPDGDYICEFGDSTHYYPTQGHPPTIDDARLMAAAPDLLGALKELRDWHKGEYHSNPLIDARVDAAIAKAEGQ